MLAARGGRYLLVPQRNWGGGFLGVQPVEPLPCWHFAGIEFHGVVAGVQHAIVGRGNVPPVGIHQRHRHPRTLINVDADACLLMLANRLGADFVEPFSGRQRGSVERDGVIPRI